MIEDYRSLAVFVAVAEAGSFSEAGRRLQLSTSVVSHHVSRLEAKHAISLFFRSTRSLSLTSEGEAMLEAAKRMVSAGEEALDTLSDSADQPVGALRVTLPAFGAHADVHQALWAFVKEHRMVAMTVHSSDRQLDLVKGGYDLAIRLGVLSDSSYISRRIGSFQRTLVASPDYLASRPEIKDLDELKRADFISLAMVPDKIELTRDGEQVDFEPENVSLQVDNAMTGKAAVLAGLGIQRLPLSEVREEIDAGLLVQVLPSWTFSTLGVFAVWPDVGPQKKLTRRLIDYLVNKKKA